MRKLLCTAGVLVFMSLLLPGAAHPQTVGACGWYIERNHPGYQLTYDQVFAKTIAIYYEVVTYSDGCGHRYYSSEVWTGDGMDAYLTATIRVWVCGVYQGSRSTGRIWAVSATVYSYTYFYPGCGRQADNYRSSSTSPLMYPDTSVYLDQG